MTQPYYYDPYANQVANVPDLSSPDVMSGLTNISGLQAPGVSGFNFGANRAIPGILNGPGSSIGITANRTIPNLTNQQLPQNGVLNGLGKLGGWLGKHGQTINAWGNVAMNGINAFIGLKQLGLAKDAFKFEKAAFKTNLANQIDSYNTQMKDRTTGRWYATEEERQAALKEAELPPGMRG